MDELIKQLVDRCREKFDYYDIVDECSEMVDYGSIIEFLLGQIANGVTISSLETVKKEWISSKDRKPTKEDADKIGRVLVMEYGAISLVKYQGPINFPDKFTHWMPLHEPPKGE